MSQKSAMGRHKNPSLFRDFLFHFSSHLPHFLWHHKVEFWDTLSNVQLPINKRKKQHVVIICKTSRYAGLRMKTKLTFFPIGMGRLGAFDSIWYIFYLFVPSLTFYWNQYIASYRNELILIFINQAQISLWKNLNLLATYLKVFQIAAFMSINRNKVIWPWI